MFNSLNVDRFNIFIVIKIELRKIVGFHGKPLYKGW